MFDTFFRNSKHSKADPCNCLSYSKKLLRHIEMSDVILTKVSRDVEGQRESTVFY